MSDQDTLPAAVLWDMDGTLVDSEKIWDISLDDLAAELGGVLSPGTRAAMVGSNQERTITMLLAEVGVPYTEQGAEEASNWLTKRTAELFTQGLPWRPGAQEALRLVRETGLPTALVTSTQRDLTELALDTIGREYFDFTLCGDEVTRTKPHPEPYLTAAARLGVNPARCLVVEDSPTGASSGAAAGATVLVVPCEVPVEPGPRRVFRDSLENLDLATLAAICEMVAERR
ncbi:HAD superfamily hydrolase (TIGR01509 family) [Crossiella equi]|uniref:HAD superfamily hydrolase (TIGR01509 family) n=1 Tax=Crossiella equi TaxID=130796 RepID=A0ABS5A492_9PSEU|nr:HAD family phosphatase [Crossiella equi]MBP2471395.1 HAD superfamily hydrolase (TIGR01509 family) [Crossiella equi]